MRSAVLGVGSPGSLLLFVESKAAHFNLRCYSIIHNATSVGLEAPFLLTRPADD